MKTGDLVGLVDLVDDTEFERFGVVIRVDDSHRQTCADVLFSTGLTKVWEAHMKVIQSV